MADAIRHFDWSATSIGPMPDWPPALSTLAGVMLAADRPMWIGWGDNLTILYNDAYAAILGAKHPAALGRPVADVWPEARAQVAPLFARVLAGEAIKRDDLTFTTERHGWPEEAHFAVSYTPVRDPSGRVAGIFGTNNETTDAVLTARRSERERWRLARMFEQAPSFMMLLEGPEHRLTLANAAARNFAGGRVLVGRTLAEALPEAAAQGYVALLDEVFASGQPYRSTGARLLLDPPSGGPPDERFMEFIYQPLFDGPGQVTGIFVEGTDITRHVRAVERHRESEEHLRLALDFGDLGSWHYDAACGKLLRSARHDEIYGYDSSLPAAGYDKFLDHITPQDRAAVDAALASAAAGGGPWRFECRITRLDSEERWIGVRGRPVLDDQGRISRVFGTIADITERKQDELRLRDLNARLEAEIAQGRTDRDRLELALNAAGVIGVWDGDLVAKIVYGDANFARIYGVDPAAAIAGQPLGHYYAFIHPDDRAAAHDIHQSVLAEGQIYAHDHRIIRPNGEVRYIQARGYMQRDAAGTPVRFAGVSLDQTERRVAERRQMLMLDLADRMRQADDPETLLLAASVALGRHLRVSRVGYAQALPDGQMVKITCGYVDGVPDISGVIPMNRFGEDLLAPVRRGETIAIEDVTVGAAPEHIARWQEISTRAHAAVPLVREGVYRGSLYVSHHQPRS
jgi:PAS domain S-box-containing protein